MSFFRLGRCFPIPSRGENSNTFSSSQTTVDGRSRGGPHYVINSFIILLIALAEVKGKLFHGNRLNGERFNRRKRFDGGMSNESPKWVKS